MLSSPLFNCIVPSSINTQSNFAQIKRKKNGCCVFTRRLPVVTDDCCGSRWRKGVRRLIDRPTQHDSLDQPLLVPTQFSLHKDSHPTKHTGFNLCFLFEFLYLFEAQLTHRTMPLPAYCQYLCDFFPHSNVASASVSFPLDSRVTSFKDLRTSMFRYW